MQTFTVRYGKTYDTIQDGWTMYPREGWAGMRNRVLLVKDEDKMEEVDIKTMHHRNAPDTEIEAAEKVAPRVTGLRLKVLLYLSMNGPRTGEEVATGLEEWLYSIKPRITELARFGLVEDTGERKLNVRKRKEIIWQITDKGEDELHAK